MGRISDEIPQSTHHKFIYINLLCAEHYYAKGTGYTQDVLDQLATIPYFKRRFKVHPFTSLHILTVRANRLSH